MFEKPFSQACVNNQEPIRSKLAPFFESGLRVLEIGSGTGQHGAYFTAHHPQLIWQPSDVAAHLPGIEAWRQEGGASNLLVPLTLDINQPPALTQRYPAIYTANTLHIMSMDEVALLFKWLPAALEDDAMLFVYGPFRYHGEFTSPSNAAFDASLKGRAPHQGIRDIEWISELATEAGLSLQTDHSMPANNQLLIFKR